MFSIYYNEDLSLKLISAVHLSQGDIESSNTTYRNPPLQANSKTGNATPTQTRFFRTEEKAEKGECGC